MNGRELKERVELLGVSQRKLAEMMGVTPQTINTILTAKDVRTSTIERIAIVTGKPISFFFGQGHEAQNAIASEANSEAVIQSAVSQGNSSALQERVCLLEKLLDEKERTIKILMEK